MNNFTSSWICSSVNERTISCKLLEFLDLIPFFSGDRDCGLNSSNLSSPEVQNSDADVEVDETEFFLEYFVHCLK